MEVGPFNFNTVTFGAHMELANEIGLENCLLRQAGLRQFAYDLLCWFEQLPTLESVKLQATIRFETYCDSEAVITLRHHFQISGIGLNSLFPNQKSVDEYVMQALPWKTIGEGIFEIHRDNVLTQAYLERNKEDDDQFLDTIERLVRKIDFALGKVTIRHDVGHAAR